MVQVVVIKFKDIWISRRGREVDVDVKSMSYPSDSVKYNAKVISSYKTTPNSDYRYLEIRIVKNELVDKVVLKEFIELWKIVKEYFSTNSDRINEKIKGRFVYFNVKNIDDVFNVLGISINVVDVFSAYADEILPKIIEPYTVPQIEIKKMVQIGGDYPEHYLEFTYNI